METTYFLRTVYEKHHLVSLRNFIMHKIKTSTLTTGSIKKKNFKGTVERFVAIDYTFSFMGSVKRTRAYWKQFLYNVLPIVK